MKPSKIQNGLVSKLCRGFSIVGLVGTVAFVSSASKASNVAKVPEESIMKTDSIQRGGPKKKNTLQRKLSFVNEEPPNTSNEVSMKTTSMMIDDEPSDKSLGYISPRNCKIEDLEPNGLKSKIKPRYQPKDENCDDGSQASSGVGISTNSHHKIEGIKCAQQRELIIPDSLVLVSAKLGLYLVNEPEIGYQVYRAAPHIFEQVGILPWNQQMIWSAVSCMPSKESVFFGPLNAIRCSQKMRPIQEELICIEAKPGSTYYMNTAFGESKMFRAKPNNFTDDNFSFLNLIKIIKDQRRGCKVPPGLQLVAAFATLSDESCVVVSDLPHLRSYYTEQSISSGLPQSVLHKNPITKLIMYLASPSLALKLHKLKDARYVEKNKSPQGQIPREQDARLLEEILGLKDDGLADIHMVDERNPASAV